MKFNINDMLEDFDISTLDSDEEDDFAFNGPDEEDEIAYIDGKFYYNDGSDKLTLVPEKLQSRYLQEYENWQLEQELADDPEYNKEKSLADEQERQEKNKNKLSSKDGIGKKILDNENKKAMFRGSNIEKKAIHSKHNIHDTDKFIDPSMAVIEEQITNLLKNLLADEYEKVPERRIHKGYAPQDHYASEVVGPDIAMKARNRHREKIKKIKEKETPYVLFYFDQSSSFTMSKNQWKVDKGEQVREIFLKYEYGSPEEGIEPGQLKVKTKYFGDKVSDNPPTTWWGNKNGILQPDIQKEVGDKVANIVIITDSDLRGEYIKQTVNGNVWYLFFENEAPELTKCIYGVGDPKKGMGINTEFFFTGN